MHGSSRLQSLAAAALLLVCATSTATAQPLRPVTPQSAPGAALVERLRGGGLVLFFRHADTTGMACDSGYRIGERSGQRNISAVGQDQARRVGRAFQALRIPVQEPVLAGPVFRARDTAELAFGADKVRVTDSLLADDYAGGRLDWVLAEHRRLYAAPTATGRNRVLFGHRGPAGLVLGAGVRGDAFPEGSALVIEPGQGGPKVIGVLALAPVENAVESC